MRIEYHPSLNTELEEVRDYYESQSFGLGGDFVGEFERQVLKIAAMPERWMIVRGDLRRSLMKRFPYVIFFRILESDVIRVTVVKHEKRHPSFGMRENRPNKKLENRPLTCLHSSTQESGISFSLVQPSPRGGSA